MNNRIFEIDDNQLWITKPGIGNSILVPENEPVFILRARDKKALSTIRAYQSIFAPTSEHWKVIQNVIDDFTKFREENPILMGAPSGCY